MIEAVVLERKMIGLTFLRGNTTSKRRKAESESVFLLDDVMKKAREALANGNASVAYSTLAPLLGNEPIPPEVRLTTARVLYELRRFAEASTHLEAYLDQNPFDVEALIIAGLVAAELWELAKAADYFNRACLALRGNTRELLLSLGNEFKPDPIAVEEMIEDIQAYPEDTERALALACALGRAGHFKAASRFLWVFDPKKIVKAPNNPTL